MHVFIMKYYNLIEWFINLIYFKMQFIAEMGKLNFLN